MSEFETKTENKRRVRKAGLRERLLTYLDEYKNVLVCGVTNVGSNQMQQVRIKLRGRAVVLMGKNTLIRKVMKEKVASNPKLENLIPLIVGTVGLVFTNGDLKEIRKEIAENKVPAAAKSGQIAPVNVICPPGPTGMDPGQTSFFQALNIATKISRGAIEIISEVLLVKEGDKVTASHVALLSKLNIKPFFYGIIPQHVYEDGSVYEAELLDLKPEDLFLRFFNGVNKLAAVSLAIGYPTIAALPHMVGNAFKKIVALALATDYDMPEVAALKAAAAAGPAVTAGAAPAEEAPKEEEPEEEEEEDIGFSLFD